MLEIATTLRQKECERSAHAHEFQWHANRRLTFYPPVYYRRKIGLLNLDLAERLSYRCTKPSCGSIIHITLPFLSLPPIALRG